MGQQVNPVLYPACPSIQATLPLDGIVYATASRFCQSLD